MDSDNIRISIDKAVVATLPIITYQGTPVVVDTLDKAADAVGRIKNETIVGFDTETRPTFNKGQRHNVALMQISTDSVCYLFRINKIGLISPLLDILTSPHITKIGLSLKDDFMMLHRLAEFTPQAFIDLQSYVGQFHIIDSSLQKIFAILFGQKISKGQRLTNWEADILSPAQQQYAALDARACQLIYDYLSQGHFNPATSPYILPPEPVETT